ncbi:Maf family nucleotide pyrophosphatase [Myroides sp. LJL119]
MLQELFKDYQIILGSNSPRRQGYLKELGLDFIVESADIDESFPSELKGFQITDHIALNKSKAITITKENQILITSDTTVWHKDQSLGKPQNKQQAFEMLKSLSDNEHQVFTSVVLRSLKKTKTFHCVTTVQFAELTDQQINFYIDNYKPYDKAGSYGIQEWIGLVGISEIKGSYTNIVGLPTYELIKELTDFIK